MRPHSKRLGEKVPGSIFGNGPTSLVAAEIHLGHKPTGFDAPGCTATFKLCAMRAPDKTNGNSITYLVMRESTSPRPLTFSGKQPKN
jgi:hypothetical protein